VVKPWGIFAIVVEATGNNDSVNNESVNKRYGQQYGEKFFFPFFSCVAHAN